jgi:hypothetical protein
MQIIVIDELGSGPISDNFIARECDVGMAP